MTPEHLPGNTNASLPIRLFHPEVYGLEIWDLEISRGILGQWINTPEFPQMLSSAIEQLRTGTAKRRYSTDQTTSLELAKNFDLLFIGGGHASQTELSKAFKHSPFTLCFADQHSYICERGGFAFLAENSLSGMVIDVGQTSLKISYQDQRFCFERDFSNLPASSPKAAGKLREYRPLLCSFIAESILAVGQELNIAKAQAFLFALPCEIDQEGTPGSSSYPGLEGYRDLLSQVLSQVNFLERKIFIINDAELAACSARLDPQIDNNSVTLAITLGYGVGAAVIRPD